jgi:hypothetical protein
MTAEGSGTALAQVSDHLALDGAHPMGRRIMLPMLAQEVAEFGRRPLSG